MTLFYIPCPDLACARQISTTLLEEKLIACANILPSMESHYWWQGRIEHSQECVLLVKTLDQPSLETSLIPRIEELHPYDTPCILKFNNLKINDAYKNWLEESLR